MRTTLTLSVLLMAAATQGQVTLTYALLEQDGVALSLHVMTDPGTAIFPGGGMDQDWDLSSITLAEVGTMDFVAASATPYAASYPAANWAWSQDVIGLDPNFIYLAIDGAAISLIATDVPDGPNIFTDPERIVEFPLAYDDSFTDTYSNIDGDAEVTWTYIGYGTLTTPLGVFTDVANLESSDGDLVLWNTDPLYPLVIDNGDDILFYAPAEGNGIRETATEHPVVVFPNPATNTLAVRDAAQAPWRILDMQGRLLRTGRFAAAGSQQLDVSDLATGSYLLELREATGTRVARFDKQ